MKTSLVRYGVCNIEGTGILILRFSANQCSCPRDSLRCQSPVPPAILYSGFEVMPKSVKTKVLVDKLTALFCFFRPFDYLCSTIRLTNDVHQKSFGGMPIRFRLWHGLC